MTILHIVTGVYFCLVLELVTSCLIIKGDTVMGGLVVHFTGWKDSSLKWRFMLWDWIVLSLSADGDCHHHWWWQWWWRWCVVVFRWKGLTFQWRVVQWMTSPRRWTPVPVRQTALLTVWVRRVHGRSMNENHTSSLTTHVWMTNTKTYVHQCVYAVSTLHNNITR